MAEDKKSILVYADWKNIFEELSDEEAGRLIKHFFRYVNDLNPQAPDRLTKLLFEPIKQTLKRDLVKYEEKREKNRQNALLRWNKSDATGCEGKKDHANHADSDSVSVSDSDNVIDNGKKKKEPDEPADFIDQIISLFVCIHGDYEILNRGKERAAACKILQIYKKKYPAAKSEGILAGLKSYFESCMGIQDVWMQQNMSLPLIVSKFNEINKILKNGTNRRNNSKAPDGSGVGDVITGLGKHLNIPER
jgi:hypothetical protein